MKKLVTVVLTIFISTLGYSQKCNPDLLSDECFNKMIIDDVTYAIFGENNPVTGIKVDISKPEGTISGVFNIENAPWILIGFDLKGGVTDKNFSIFEGLNDFNSAFEVRPNFHFIPSWSSAWFECDDVPIVKAKNRLIENNILATKDTFLVVLTIYNKYMSNFFQTSTPNLSVEQRRLLIYFVKKFTNQALSDLTDSSTTEEILSRITLAVKDDDTIDEKTYNDEIINTYRKYKALTEEIPIISISKQIDNAKNIWTKKQLIWFTVSPFAKTEFINFYHTKYHDKNNNTDIDSSYFKKEYPFFYGISGSINFMWVYPEKIAHYLTAGINLSHSNNLPSINSFNYETITAFYSYPNNVTEKTKTGIAYNYSDFNKDFLSQLSVEYYLLPLKNFIPGFYVNGSMGLSNLYSLPKIEGRENDIFTSSIEGGLVFNINSRVKDTELSILSLSTYVRFEDLTDTIRKTTSTGLTESKEDYYKRNLSFGIKLGVPINLPQREKK